MSRRRKNVGGRYAALLIGVVVALIICFIVAGSEQSRGEQGSGAQQIERSIKPRRVDFTGICTRVIDGDTIEVQREDTRETVRVRIWGIDAPEKKQEGGAEATETLRRLCEGERVSVVKRGSSYGRIVGQVRVGERSAALWQLLRGQAWYYERYAPTAQGLKKAQEKARKRKRGIWASPGAVPPWQYRHP